MAKVDVALHLAPQLANQAPFLGVDVDVELLVDSTAAFTKAALDAGVKFLVHTSFTTLYSDTHGEIVTESAPLTHSTHPLLAAVKRAERVAQQSSVPLCILRAGYVYGADSIVLSELENTLKVGRKSVPVGPGDNFANWIHIDDFAAALLLVVEQQHPARILDPRVVAPVEKFGAAL